MPLTRLIADAFGVVTICLVTLLVLLGLFCISYSVYFRCHIRRQGYSQLNYFNNPWIIRILFILFAFWWGFGEIVRLSLFRYQKRVVHSFDPKWQTTVCKFYLISNLGFAEPCMLLTIIFLLRASLKQKVLGAPRQNWNGKTAIYIFLSCLPMFILQLTAVLVGPKLNHKQKLPPYFTRSAVPRVYDNSEIDLCTYPLVSTILHGLSISILISYIFWFGTRIWYSVINKGLQRRVLLLIGSVCIFFPLRVIFLGLSVLSRPELFSFEALTFTAFLVVVCCSGIGICLLVYYPISDSLALKGLGDIEIGRRPEASSTTSAGRYSDDSTKRGSISFRTMLPPDSPLLPGQPDLPQNQSLQP